MPLSSKINRVIESPEDLKYFSFLPKKIRLTIWRCAAETNERTIFFQSSEGHYSFIYDNIPVSLFAVNHEARTEILKMYTKIEGRQEGDQSRRDTIFRAPFYFNPLLDTIGVTSEMEFRSLNTLLKLFEHNGICAGTMALEMDVDRRRRLRLRLHGWGLYPWDSRMVRWSANLEDESNLSKELVEAKTFPKYTTVQRLPLAPR